MNTKKRVILSAILCTTLVFVACEKKEMKPETPQEVEKHQLIHRYTYHDQTFQIEFNYDNNDSLLGITGDVESLQKIQKLDIPPAAYLVEQSVTEENTYDIHVFDDVAKMNTHQIKEGVSIPTVEKQCTDWTSVGGTANYRFYEHAGYVGELTYLTTNNQSYFQRDLWSAENDKISSLKIWGTATTGASVDLFEHGCFSGRTIRYTCAPGQVVSIGNMDAFMDICVDVIRDVYGQVIQINSYPCGHQWNDKTSSIKGWSI